MIEELEKKEMINEEKFKLVVIAHNKKIAKLGILLKGKTYSDKRTKEEALAFDFVIRTGKELALARSGFKCEKTGKKDNLQYHHLIGRPNKKILSFQKYATQRNYWANIVILNQSYHEGNSQNSSVIPEKQINKIKKKYNFFEDID